MLNERHPVCVLGSRSPRRRELLSLIWPVEFIHVRPPQDGTEAGFAGLTSEADILERLTAITEQKYATVRRELALSTWELLITADTIVIAADDADRTVVLGKPDGPDWQAKTRDWFHRYYFGKSHQVITAVRMGRPDGTSQRFTDTTRVTFLPSDEQLLKWYLSTGEPLGKAGGYGLQGAGSLFIDSVSGSLSNVIGLPLERVWQVLAEWNVLPSSADEPRTE